MTHVFSKKKYKNDQFVLKKKEIILMNSGNSTGTHWSIVKFIKQIKKKERIIF